jgi:hypothetical protein
MRSRVALSLVLLIPGVACTSTRVFPIPAGHPMVLVVENPKVIVPEFIFFLCSAFERHGIAARTVKEKPLDAAVPHVTYTAIRGWDLGTYLTDAEIVVHHGDRVLGSAKYHLIGKGGLSLMKWQSVPTKLTPVMDELLSAYPLSEQSTDG